MILVSKPNTLLRLRLTCEAQWPEIEFRCSAPELRFPGEVSETIGLEGVIHEMVGDIQRIQDYPSRGYQASHKLPRDILEAWGIAADRRRDFRSAYVQLRTTCELEIVAHIHGKAVVHGREKGLPLFPIIPGGQDTVAEFCRQAAFGIQIEHRRGSEKRGTPNRETLSD